ncbi:hypothetical protein ACFYVL_43945 [Streptomyces sp. NPDC004111]|uniref:hypothetical protein n=1 Tax=Streptomyces sp. NPDC004111 TaxID=3364690 RepID=UPI0036A22A78
MSDTIRITPSTTGKRMLITSPYNADFVDAVKEIGGRWDATKRAWSVAARDEERARALMREYYGTDGTGVPDLVTVRIRLDLFEQHGSTAGAPAEAHFAGRVIASRPARDAKVRLHQGVVLVEGTLPGAGGSMRYPRLHAPDAVVEVRDVPRAALGQYQANWYTIVEEDTAPQTSEAEQLRARRAELLAQVAELDTLLHELDPQGPDGTPPPRDDEERQDQERAQLVATVTESVTATVTASVTARLNAEHLRDKSDAIRELVRDQETREQQRAEHEQHERDQAAAREQRERDQAAARAHATLIAPLACRCGAHTCPPVGLTVAQYAAQQGISPSAAHARCRVGSVPAVQYRSRWYITPDPT